LSYNCQHRFKTTGFWYRFRRHYYAKLLSRRICWTRSSRIVTQETVFGWDFSRRRATHLIRIEVVYETNAWRHTMCVIRSSETDCNDISCVPIPSDISNNIRVKISKSVQRSSGRDTRVPCDSETPLRAIVLFVSLDERGVAGLMTSDARNGRRVPLDHILGWQTHVSLSDAIKRESRIEWAASTRTHTNYLYAIVLPRRRRGNNGFLFGCWRASAYWN
jgi:hypothetical protein